MSNSSSSVSKKGLSMWEITLMAKGGVLSKYIDDKNKTHDDKFGKPNLTNDFKSISNSSFAEMKKMQSDIPGFKK